jgi:hypothetical protein
MGFPPFEITAEGTPGLHPTELRSRQREYQGLAMSDWFDDKLEGQALRDKRERDEMERRRLQLDAITRAVPPYLADLTSHIEDLLSRYNDTNVGRVAREVSLTVEPNHGFSIGTSGIGSPTRAVYCSVALDTGTIATDWRLPVESGPRDGKRDLLVRVRADGSVIVSDGTLKYENIDALARYLLVPILFPGDEDERPTRGIALDDDDDSLFGLKLP